MKTATLLFAVFCITSLASASIGITIYIRKAPPPPKHENVQHNSLESVVWVKGHWQWDGNRYIWQAGRWLQDKENRIWVDGHWEQSRHGYVWKSGYWKERIDALQNPGKPASE